MDFGQAIAALKEGKMVRRSGWNGKGMFLFIRPEFTCGYEDFKKLVSVPMLSKDMIASDMTLNDLSSITFTAYISMYAANKTIVNGWLASQTDMLSEDWEIVN